MTVSIKATLTICLAFLMAFAVQTVVFAEEPDTTDVTPSTETTMSDGDKSALYTLRVELLAILQQLVALLTAAADATLETVDSYDTTQENDDDMPETDDATDETDIDNEEDSSEDEDGDSDDDSSDSDQDDNEDTTVSDQDDTNDTVAVDETLSCVVDADCTYVMTDCSDCNIAVINMSSADSFNAEKAIRCELDPPMYMCGSVYPGDAKCIDNVCTKPEQSL